MTAALIGLAGIIIGALLAGPVEARLERRKRRAAAIAASQLISAELSNAADILETSTGWWKSRLPTRAWKKHDGSLVSFPRIPPKIIRDLADSYTAIDHLNAKWEAAIPPNATKPTGPPPPAKELADTAEILRTAAKSLDEKLIVASWLGAIRNFFIRFIAPTALVALALFLLGDAVFVARPNVNERTVARALEDKIGPQVLVDCKGAGDDFHSDDFHCAVYTISPSRNLCLTSVSRAKKTNSVRSLAASAQAEPCQVGPEEGQLTAHPEEGPDLAITNATGDELITRLKNRVLSKPTESEWDRFKRYVSLD